MRQRAFESLDAAERFVVAAARFHRAIRGGGSVEPTKCVCGMFRSAGLMPALASFAFLQDALGSDPDRTFDVADPGTTHVTSGEMLLLEVVRRWQWQPAADSHDALDFLRCAGVRRMAAPAGRAFAVAMKAAGLILPATCYAVPATPQLIRVDPPDAAAVRRLH